MDIDNIISLRKAIGIHNEEDLDDENDEELMAELLALQDENGMSSQKKVSQTAKVVMPKKMESKSSKNDHPTKQNIPITIPSFEEHADVEISDADLLNDDLLSELDALVGNKVKNEAIKPNQDSAQMHAVNNDGNIQLSERGNSRPAIPPRTNVCDKDQVPSDPITDVVPQILPPPPPIPPRNSSITSPQPDETHTPITVDANKPVHEESNSSLETRAHSLLSRRRKLYLDIAKAAKTANDRAAAVDAFETVKLFNQALEAMKEGVQLTEEDLSQIPPSPPPYGSVTKQLLAGHSDEILEQPTTTSKIPSKNDKKPDEASKSSEKSGDKSMAKEQPWMSEELKLVLMRQQQLKKEALAAKQRGDLQAAKEFLTLAHRMDQMVEAAKCGLPIDVQQIPKLIPNSIAIPSSVSKRSPTDPGTLKKCQLLENELLKQIEFCREKIGQFQSVGDSRNVLLYEGLQQNSKKDLQSVQVAMLGNSALPGFKMVELLLPNIELNPSVPDDQLRLKIQKIDNLKLPEGWKPKDCSLFVLYKFPFPHGAHQTGSTPIVRNTNSPEYSSVFNLNISRKGKQFSRICQKIPLKLEIYHKGGFMRSDKLFGHANISLQELEQNAHIKGHFDILEGRKKTGGLIHVEIQISKPLGNDHQMSTSNAGIKRKWVKLLDNP